MSLRTRITLLVALVVTVVVAGAGVRAHGATEAELVEEVDLELRDRADAVVSGPGRGPGVRDFVHRGMRNQRGGSPMMPTPDDAPDLGDAFAAVIERGTFARILDTDGTERVAFGREFEADASPAVLDRAAVGPVLGDAVIDGRPARVVTVALDGGAGYVQIARPLGEIEQSLADLRTRLVMIGFLAVAAAAGAVWFLVGRTLRPVARLTDATERVAATGELDQVVDGSGGDEVGRLAGSFNTMLAALDGSRRQQRRLVMDASHELRTPLTSLRTNVDVLRSGRPLDPETHAAVIADIGAEVEELGELVAELVDLAVELRPDEEREPFELLALVAEVADRQRRRSGRSIPVEAGRRAVVEAQPEAVRRAVRNLIENAAKFSPSDTPIRVVVDGGQVTVHDHGPGIPEADREAVFERFHRLESTRTLPGSGLGLAIVRQVAEAHGGSAVAAASPDGGAAVSFTVPTVDD